MHSNVTLPQARLFAGNFLRWAVAGYVSLCFLAALYFALFHAGGADRWAAFFAGATAAGLFFGKNLTCNKRWLWVPIITGVLLRCMVFCIHNEQVSDFKIFEELATALRHGDGFAYTGKTGLAMDVGLFINNPTAAPPVVTAFRLPGYPLLLAATMCIVNNQRIASFVLNCLLQLIIAVVLYRVGYKWSAAGAVRVLWLWALYPASVFLTALSCSELAFTALLALLVLFLETVWIERPGSTSVKTALFGFMCGCLVLVRPASQMVVCGALVVVASIGVSKKMLFRILIYLLGVALPLSVWGVRNLQVFGHFELQTTEIGLGWYTLTREYFPNGADSTIDSLVGKMALSNNEFERARIGKKIGYARLKKAIVRGALFGRMGLNHLKVWRTDDETGWIVKGLPSGHAAERFFARARSINVYWYLLILGCGCLGALAYAKNRQHLTAGMLFAATGFLGTGVLFFLFEGQPRYHIPFMLLILLLAGFGGRTSVGGGGEPDV